MTLPAGEPPAGPFERGTVASLATMLGLAGRAPGRPWVVAVDGRGGAGKSTLSRLLAEELGPAAVVHTDDLAWHEPFFGWGGLLRAGVLEPLHRGEAVDFRPPQWVARGREGSIAVPAGLRAVVVEGAGARQEEYADLIDATVWVQAEVAEAERRGVARDVAEGTNGDEDEARAFWREWTSHETPFFAAQRPWKYALAVVAGTPVPGFDALGQGELAIARGPLRS